MKRIIAFLILVSACVASSCTKEVPDDKGGSEEYSTDYRYYVNTFAYNVMKNYYLWAEEISSALGQWKTDADPVEKVKEIRYKDSAGKDIDKWTTVTDDYESYVSSTNGSKTTNGIRIQFYYANASSDKVYGVVTYTYKDSPAEKAGFKRGDVISEVNGTAITKDNLSALSRVIYYESGKFKLLGGSERQMTAVQMYEEPVHTVKTFDFDGKKVGYIHYTNFTPASTPVIVEALDNLRKEGVKELIFDLRYNGGGYSLTEEAIASMLAPESSVNAGAVYQKTIFNDKITNATGGVDIRFQTSFKVNGNDGEITVDTSGKNLKLSKLYFITSSRSASASESLICGLKPYLDLTLIGDKTYGKFCGGNIIKANKWYEDVKEQMISKGKEELYKNGLKYADNWGIYVMTARYADKNGLTRSMPDGIPVDISVSDDPRIAVELGDPNEVMLAKVLEYAGYRKTTPKSCNEVVFDYSTPVENQPEIQGWGIKINDL